MSVWEEADEEDDGEGVSALLVVVGDGQRLRITCRLMRSCGENML